MNLQEKRLYDLIRKRTLASQMADALIDKTDVRIAIDGTDDTFTATGEVIRFDGFLRLYRESHDDDTETQDDGRALPPMTVGQRLACGKITAAERYTQQPPRYTEASLVKKLEELGIGRPSTYAPTISTIQQREYVVKGDREGERKTFAVITLSDAQRRQGDTLHQDRNGRQRSGQTRPHRHRHRGQ